MEISKDSLGDRMKGYEDIPKTRLMRRTPVIGRLDGKAFHTFTRGMIRPFDSRFHNAMCDTAIYLCENIQGCKLAYIQSDEISLLLTDYETYTTDAWFGYQVQKMCSVAASMATAYFNFCVQLWPHDPRNLGLAHFDARFWNVSKDEVVNTFIWRQQDATRNSIQMAGQAHFSHSQLHGKSCSQIQDMLMLEHGVNWNDYPTPQKRGSCVRRAATGDWILVSDIPIFTQDRNYIEGLL